MASIEVAIDAEAAEAVKTRAQWQRVTQEEVEAFNAWFRSPERGGSSLIPYEKEMLRSFFWWKFKEKSDADPSPTDQ